MTDNKSIRKEPSAEDRKVDQFLFTNKGIKTVQQPEIWMTPELKKAAQALQNAWEISHDEQMGSLAIRDVNLKFGSKQERAGFYNALGNLAKLVNPNFPSTYPIQNPTTDASTGLDGVWLNFWYKYFLPHDFDVVMQDAAGTELNTIRTRTDILVQAKAYLETYGPGFIRMDLVVGEGVDRGLVDSLTSSLRQAQIRLVKFLSELMKCVSDSAIHGVIILGLNEFEVDGERREFTGAALRALLVLARLGGQADFKLEDFAQLYSGNTSDSRTDFDNAMKALRKELPNLSGHTPSQNHRSIKGIRFQVSVSDEAIEQRLANLRKK